MSAEAADHPTPSTVTPSVQRRRGRPRIDLRRLGRAALLGPAARDRLPDAIGHVVEAHRAHFPDADIEPLRKAYVLAESSHRGQMRKSGEPYITHPLAVTLILAELGAETTTLTASLLHDTVEDTEVTLDQVGAEFGEEVRYLVDGVTKLEKVDYGAAAEPETFRKMLVATGSDVRVMSIKLADRLHNVRTLGVMRPEKQARIAKVTRDVLIPLAERLGVQALKTELEDLVFAILHPEEYEQTRELIAANAARDDDPLGDIAEEVRSVLRDAGISAEVLIRPRHFLSVHRVRRKRGELRGADFGRLLVLVNEVADCYGVLGELHTCLTPVVSEFKDFIAVPKFNLYQSLHTAVALPQARTDAPGGGPAAVEVAEVLIRTHQMHKVAEAGVIALGNPYAPAAEDAADGERPEGERVDPTRPGWLSRLLEWQQAAPDPDTFWSTLREDLAQDGEITVFRPDGGRLGLPAGASCVDAAYAQYGEDAHACIGARVNGRLATLSTVLRDGDTVQLLMGQDPGSGPSREWLDHARTPAARIAISRWLASHPSATGALPAMSTGRLRPAAGATKARTAEPRRAADATPAGSPAGANVVVDQAGATARLAGCCTPVPPDAVIAFAVRGGVVTVHREECPAVGRMKGLGRTEVGVRWGDTAECRVTLIAESFGRPHLLADLTEVIALEGAAIVSATVEPPSQQRVRHTYTLQLPDAAHLPGLMRAMRNVPGVYDVSRAQYSATATT
ncbi:bifunctional (p)ppGpp synthetase/guanosine-3',5'-bis(diphosphate) 3'-pyrophosphohydrolase [Streptomyces sp. PSKA54]|uniref:Bifunctional (P)ppGpp synthetase/guanosine-3',5'-bis(Diphosphate) 3'-pyrophosphohydrolase n=1 Tax=Streptomyces himalayensis subsp. aureolus TaxID=2758039 RepID=A0A7W2D0H0_9ACTN|nr:HD domain-containing protein [Streptomyces himalayensis]MBA4862346.1 bifunctional (p)ppGpp synthetase/guanosine-3',5'-bis(diphosphate) 3'-pyrophosphohydrolase [Streptomyces himalayensis subsp. aureolus]